MDHGCAVLLVTAWTPLCMDIFFLSISVLFEYWYGYTPRCQYNQFPRRESVSRNGPAAHRGERWHQKAKSAMYDIML